MHLRSGRHKYRAEADKVVAGGGLGVPVRLCPVAVARSFPQQDSIHSLRPNSSRRVAYAKANKGSAMRSTSTALLVVPMKTNGAAPIQQHTTQPYTWKMAAKTCGGHDRKASSNPTPKYRQ
ncbi:hypothetical protein ACLOJK_032514 [Asimina triloba]